MIYVLLSQWFITLCLWLYCTYHKKEWSMYFYHSDLSRYVSDCTVLITRKNDLCTSNTVIYQAMSLTVLFLLNLVLSGSDKNMFLITFLCPQSGWDKNIFFITYIPPLIWYDQVQTKTYILIFILVFTDWTEENEDKEDINVWEDNWDDDNLDDDFSIQLR